MYNGYTVQCTTDVLYTVTRKYCKLYNGYSKQ